MFFKNAAYKQFSYRHWTKTTRTMRNFPSGSACFLLLPRCFPTRSRTILPPVKVMRCVPFSRLLFSLFVITKLLNSKEVSRVDSLWLHQMKWWTVQVSCLISCLCVLLALTSRDLMWMKPDRTKPCLCGYLSRASPTALAESLYYRDIWW